MESLEISAAVEPAGCRTRDEEKDQYYEQDQVEQLKSRERIIQAARNATKNEQNMTLMQGIRLYPKAIAWSILISTCIVMEGYDICLINNFCRSCRLLFGFVSSRCS
jgi:SP family general alpha glucoside:H+ symporter-like MFS transporter